MRCITFTTFLCLFVTSLMAQTTDRVLADFRISLVEKDDQIVLKCEKGCAWTQLSYSNKRKDQGIDFYGLVNKVDWEKKDHNGLFFKIKKDRSNKYALTGVEGTAWLKLGFTEYDKGKRFDQFGTGASDRD